MTQLNCNRTAHPGAAIVPVAVNAPEKRIQSPFSGLLVEVEWETLVASSVPLLTKSVTFTSAELIPPSSGIIGVSEGERVLLTGDRGKILIDRTAVIAVEVDRLDSIIGREEDKRIRSRQVDSAGRDFPIKPGRLASRGKIQKRSRCDDRRFKAAVKEHVRADDIVRQQSGEDRKRDQN